eukprot:TRINITY_DN36_c0_g1_i2.p2 TRINITY_DN36_c0_g1~~TRINITY_DN36_c0_g1_i2.p2  ORF type:complete len:133 (-),score=67.52 TRINITY_DN36_c0_g1_i2:246-644(-)
MSLVVRTRKFLLNKVLGRRQFILDAIHPERPNVPKAELKSVIAKKFKVEESNIVLFGFITQFGGGKSTGFCMIYDNVDLMKKYEPKFRLRRMKVLEKKTAGANRKSRKILKTKRNKVRGKEKSKVQVTKKQT